MSRSQRTEHLGPPWWSTVRIPSSTAKGTGLIPGQRSKIPRSYAAQPRKKTEPARLGGAGGQIGNEMGVGTGAEDWVPLY